MVDYTKYRVYIETNNNTIEEAFDTLYNYQAPNKVKYRNLQAERVMACKINRIIDSLLMGSSFMINIINEEPAMYYFVIDKRAELNWAQDSQYIKHTEIADIISNIPCPVDELIVIPFTEVKNIWIEER